VAGLLMLSVTYVIGDMYSASLTSILARPPKGNILFMTIILSIITYYSFEFGRFGNREKWEQIYIDVECR